MSGCAWRSRYGGRGWKWTWFKDPNHEKKCRGRLFCRRRREIDIEKEKTSHYVVNGDKY
ncbi:uncharacterized protein DS421_2g50500 [Arachis hypogaea]|nr:uncharacterized protein DS421_2g50500 [Arachis hypogaea]